jgi:hypothetical protein
VGALTPANRALADLDVWVDAPDVERKRRALLREPTYELHWDRWAAQEDTFIAPYEPRSMADWIVDETPGGLVWTPKGR